MPEASSSRNASRLGNSHRLAFHVKGLARGEPRAIRRGLFSDAKVRDQGGDQGGHHSQGHVQHKPRRRFGDFH